MLTKDGRDRVSFLDPQVRKALDALDVSGDLGKLDKAALVKRLQGDDFKIRNPDGQIELLHRLQMAAEAEFNYKYKRHYEVLRGKTAADNKIVIINQHTHATMLDPETGSESRWFGGVAQALVVEAIQAGAKDFVVKPFQPSRVLEAVQRVLG